jgi:hypothetical protein
MIFGSVFSSVDRYLKLGKRILLNILVKHPSARIKIPTRDKIEEHMASIQDRHPYLERVWCTMDGLKLNIDASGDPCKQNNFYNGWTHDHYVSCVLVFCPDGTIPICCFNVPGSVHDSSIADWGDIYTKLESVYNDCGGKCTVDSAFSRGRYGFLVKSAQIAPVGTDAYNINTDATSMRQSAEWGMRLVQSSFPRLKDRMKFEEFGERRINMKLMYRSNKIGINQIRSVYLGCLDRDANNYVIKIL